MAERDESFAIVENVLVRTVVPRRGQPYQHTCGKEVFDEVCHAIDKRSGGSFTSLEIREPVNAPYTQVDVAFAFLKERGCIVPTIRKRHVGATSDVHCDAMIEWHALREKGSDPS
jgi:hypothetical protein